MNFRLPPARFPLYFRYMYGSLLHDIRSALRGKARAAVWLLLAAVLLQFTVTRAHFHWPAAPSGIALASLDGGDAPAKPKTPLHDQTNCPLWHAGGICGGAIVVVAAVALFEPPSRDMRVAYAPAAPAPERIAASWRSRAPPTL